jgi:glyoxalase family protein
MTFFDWPNMGPNLRGSDSIAGTAFRVNSRETLDFWMKRFDEYEVSRGEIKTFSGRDLLAFEDSEGQQLYLVNDLGTDFEGEIWSRPDIPDEYALRGFYSVIFSIQFSDQLDMIFTDILNFGRIETARWIDGKSNATIYTTHHNGGPGSEVWLLEQPHLGRSRLGAGGTHHVAFRVKDLDAQKEWQARIMERGLSVSQLIDRFWFRSIYFRVSNGILFEIATDGPGFDIDEAPEKLGEKLVLPPFLENRRVEITAGLTPIGT